MQRAIATEIVVDLLETASAAIIAARDETAGVPKKLVSTVEAQLKQLRSAE